jgi:plasmid stabilization system protein ParE
MTHRVAPRAETDLDDIWLYVANESGSIEIANRLIDTLTNHFVMLAASRPKKKRFTTEAQRSRRKILLPRLAVLQFVDP